MPLPGIALPADGEAMPSTPVRVDRASCASLHLIEVAHRARGFFHSPLSFDQKVALDVPQHRRLDGRPIFGADPGFLPKLELTAAPVKMI